MSVRSEDAGTIFMVSTAEATGRESVKAFVMVSSKYPELGVPKVAPISTADTMLPTMSALGSSQCVSGFVVCLIVAERVWVKFLDIDISSAWVKFHRQYDGGAPMLRVNWLTARKGNRQAEARVRLIENFIQRIVQQANPPRR